MPRAGRPWSRKVHGADRPGHKNVPRACRPRYTGHGHFNLQCWNHQTSELLHIIKFRHWDGYFSRFAEQETVSGDLITIHHMLSLTDTEIYSEKDLDTKHSGHWPHRSSHKQTGVWIIPSPQQIISAEYKSQLKLKCWLLWCSQEGTNQSTLNITGGKSWETSIVLNGVFIDIFNFPPICCTMLY